MSSPARDQNRPLRFGLAGCGTIAITHAEALRELPEAELVSCSDVDASQAKDFAERFGLRVQKYAEMLADPDIDAVTICTPSGVHAALAVPALEAGKPVVIEKPMDITLQACDAILDAQRRSGKTVAVISQHRFDDASRLVRETLDAGGLGRLILAEIQIPWYRTQEYYDSAGWRGTMAMDGGGCLMNQGIHTVDLALWLCGPVSSIYARSKTAAHDRIEVEDVVCATIEFQNGAVGTLLATTAAYPGFPARLALHGTGGSAVIEGDALALLDIKGGSSVSAESPATHAIHIATGGTATAVSVAGSENVPAETWKWGDAHRLQLADFVHCCRTGARPLVDGTDGRSSVELVLAAYASAGRGAPVSLPLK